MMSGYVNSALLDKMKIFLSITSSGSEAIIVYTIRYMLA